MRSFALSGVPLFLLYCSASEPSEGVYLALTKMKPSAKFLIAEVRVWKVDEEDW